MYYLSVTRYCRRATPMATPTAVGAGRGIRVSACASSRQPTVRHRTHVPRARPRPRRFRSPSGKQTLFLSMSKLPPLTIRGAVARRMVSVIGGCVSPHSHSRELGRKHRGGQRDAMCADRGVLISCALRLRLLSSIPVPATSPNHHGSSNGGPFGLPSKTIQKSVDSILIK